MKTILFLSIGGGECKELPDLDDFGGVGRIGLRRGPSDMGEVVSSLCEFLEEGCVCLFFQ